MNRRKCECRKGILNKFFISAFFCLYSYIDFLWKTLTNAESLSEDQSSLSSGSSSPAQCMQVFQNGGSTGSPIVPNEKLNLMFNMWRMEGELTNSSKIE